MKEIKATAPTPQDWIDLVRENDRLIEIAKIAFVSAKMSDEYQKAYSDLVGIVQYVESRIGGLKND